VAEPPQGLDLGVPEIHDIAEEHAGAQAPVTPPPRNATLDRLRAALAEDSDVTICSTSHILSVVERSASRKRFRR
jgi:hypothetical protein